MNEENASQLVGVRFKRAGRVYYFDPADLELEVNDYVVADTPQGLEVGRVVIAPRQVLANELTEPLKPVLRKAEPEDLMKMEEFQGKEGETLARCQDRVSHFRLPMKLLGAQYNLDGSRLTVHFSSEGTVDFRELVRDLAGLFKTRVELRQVGPRDEAKVLGGVGRCGRLLCCASHLCAFNAISIRMAKDQDLPLNPTRISGLCGRLMCCMSYEAEDYRCFWKNMPPKGRTVSTPMGPATVVGGNAVKETVWVRLESEAVAEFPLSQVSSSPPA